MCNRTGIVAFLAGMAVCAASVETVAWETSAKLAYQKSRATGRPLMIVGTSVMCGPCQRMKATLAEDGGVQDALSHCHLLVLDAADPDFQLIVAHYGIPVNTVPMVYMVGADDQLVYARSGAMDADEIRTLLVSTVQQSGAPVSDRKLAATETQLDEIRVAARNGDLLTALRLVTPLADSNSTERPLATARNYRDQIVKAISAWLVELDGRLARSEQKYEAAYHVARIYVHAPPQYTTIRQHALELFNLYEGRDGTRIAMTQAKHLVLAQVEENRKRCDTAIQSYRHVEALEPHSPAGKYAHQRIPLLQKRQATKLTGAF